MNESKKQPPIDKNADIAVVNHFLEGADSTDALRVRSSRISRETRIGIIERVLKNLSKIEEKKIKKIADEVVDEI